MKNLLALAAFAVLLFAAIGWYLGWYRIRTTPTQEGHHQITIDLNSPKIGEDLQKGKDKLSKLLHDTGEEPKPETAQNPPAKPQQQWAPFLGTARTQPRPRQPAPDQVREEDFFVTPEDFFPYREYESEIPHPRKRK